MSTKYISDDEHKAISIALEYRMSEATVNSLIKHFGGPTQACLMLDVIKQMIESKSEPPRKAEMVKRLRHETDAGMMDCKTALVKTDWDYNAALKYILTNPYHGWMMR